jgi:hypothetical protein
MPTSALGRSAATISIWFYTRGVSRDVWLWEDVESWALGLDDNTHRKKWYDRIIPAADDRFDEWLSSEED